MVPRNPLARVVPGRELNRAVVDDVGMFANAISFVMKSRKIEILVFFFRWVSAVEWSEWIFCKLKGIELEREIEEDEEKRGNMVDSQMECCVSKGPPKENNTELSVYIWFVLVHDLLFSRSAKKGVVQTIEQEHEVEGTLLLLSSTFERR